ncbi:acyl-ACP thioesterase [Putridiphycobacter roseus]|uniref:Acyl-ACP thioesterase n=1 Tax=Putridiphycobacter roseus TaxID=2219161 RepID=A0A2W1N351_9FLAO|nr:acyl-ACP thioesterase [Putridiphycobacter roseus]
MNNYFDKEYDLRYFEMNKFGEASSTTMLTLLEETAAEHCYAIGHSLLDLEKQNIGWVLVSGVMELDYYPVYKDKITIRTWLSSYSTIKGVRENIIYNAAGEIIGRAKGLWVFFDIAKRRPIPILDVFKEKWSFCKTQSIEHNINRKIAPIQNHLPINKFKVNRFDVDTNKHVNNIKYLHWLMESVPEEISNNYDLHAIDGRFIAEAQYGDVILTFTADENEKDTFLHTIRTEGDQKVCATAKTIWKKRNELE